MHIIIGLDVQIGILSISQCGGWCFGCSNTAVATYNLYFKKYLLVSCKISCKKQEE